MMRYCQFVFFLILLGIHPSSGGQAADLLERGNEALAAGRTEEAIVLFTEVINETDSSASEREIALGNRASVRLSMGDPDEALMDLEAALKLNPRSETALLTRALVYGHQGRSDDALADFGRALQVNPDNHFVYYNRGNLYRRLGDAKAAMNDFTVVSRLAPEFQPAHVQIGILRAAQGQLEDALEHLNRAVALRSEPVALINRASILANLGKYDRAIADLDEVVEMAPDSVPGLHNRAYVLAETGNYAAALRDYTRCIELAPDQAMSYGNRGNAYMATGDYEAALSDYDEATRLAPADAGFLVNRARAKMRLGRYEEALRDLRKVEGLEAADSSLALVRGQVHLSAGHYKAAAAAFDEYLQSSAEEPYATLWLYLARRRTGAQPAAPLVNDAWVAKILSMLDGVSEPSDLLDSAKAGDADDSKGKRCEAFYYVGQRHLLDGDEKAAIDAFKRALETEKFRFVEHGLAAAELSQLRGEAKPVRR